MRKMKESGIDWIGAIPEDWSIKKFKYFFNIVGGSGFKEEYQGKEFGDYPFCKASDINGTEKFVSTAKNYVNEDLVLSERYSVIPEGSILIAKVGEALKKNHRKINTVSCIVDNNCEAFVPNDENDINYLYYLLKHIDMLWFDNGGTIPSVNNEKLRNFYLPSVNVEVQKRIAKFLDDKCSRLDDIIGRENQIIEKLKGYKTSLVSEHISNEKYQSVTLRYCISLIEQGNSPSPAEVIEEDGWMVLSLSAVKGGIFNPDAVKHIDSKDSSESLRLKDGDFLMTRSNTRELVGDVCIVKNCPENTIFSDLIYRITFKDTIIPEYACYALRSASARQQIQIAARGSSGSMPKISHKSIKEIKIPVPSLDEQKRIVAILDDKCSKIDADIAKRQQLIEKLTEYKKSLIFEVVTGKREV